MLGGEVLPLLKAFELRLPTTGNHLIPWTCFFTGFLLIFRYRRFGIGYAIGREFNLRSFVLIRAVGDLLTTKYMLIGHSRLLRHIQLRTTFRTAGTLACLQDAMVAEVLPLDFLTTSFRSHR